MEELRKMSMEEKEEVRQGLPSGVKAENRSTSMTSVSKMLRHLQYSCRETEKKLP